MAKRYKGTRLIVNPDTGEIEGVEENVVSLEPGDSYQTKEQVEYFMKRILPSKQRKKKGETFMKLITSASFVLQELFKDDPATRLLIQDLTPYISYPDNALKNGDEYINISSFARILNKDSSNMGKGFRKLIQYGVMAKTTLGTISGKECDIKTIYIFNPYIIRNGEHVCDAVYRLFENSGWKN